VRHHAREKKGGPRGFKWTKIFRREAEIGIGRPASSSAGRQTVKGGSLPVLPNQLELGRTRQSWLVSSARLARPPTREIQVVRFIVASKRGLLARQVLPVFFVFVANVLQ
jgi:hypothetical protein